MRYEYTSNSICPDLVPPETVRLKELMVKNLFNKLVVNNLV